MAKLSKATVTDNRGASVSRITYGDLFRAWHTSHRISALNSLSQLWKTPLQSLMTWLVVAIALALPAALFLVVGNVKMLGKKWQIEPGVTVYLRSSLSESSIADTGLRIQKLSNVLSVQYISPQEGLEQLKSYGGFGDALSILDNNPLPPVYLLRPVDNNEVMLQSLIAQVRAFPEVEKVQLDLQWAQRLRLMVVLVERTAGLLGFFLSLGVLLTISNITRLVIERRKDEISVLKLVGATDAFVRRPLLYTGMWYGLIGGLGAWFLLAGAGAVVAPVVGALLASYSSEVVLQGVSFAVLAQLLFIGALLGLAGAWLSASRYLKAIHPS